MTIEQALIQARTERTLAKRDREAADIEITATLPGYCVCAWNKRADAASRWTIADRAVQDAVKVIAQKVTET